MLSNFPVSKVLSKYTKKFSKSPYKVFAYKTNTDPTTGNGGFFCITKSTGRQSSVSRGHITKQNFFFGLPSAWRLRKVEEQYK
jgi:hypothetical protein